MDFTKKRLQQELEDKMEVEQQSRRQLERRVRLARELRPAVWRPGARHLVYWQSSQRQADLESGQGKCQPVLKGQHPLGSEDVTDPALHF